MNILFLVPLALLSVISLAIILERVVFYIRLPAALNGPLCQKLEKLLRKNANHSKAVREEAVQCVLLQEEGVFYTGLRFLRFIAVISPMLGLLGTVVGIIQVFETLSTHQGAVNPALIADGLWVALLTTAFGLIIALPSLFAAFVFTRLSDRHLFSCQTHLNRVSLELEGIVLNDD